MHGDCHGLAKKTARGPGKSSDAGLWVPLSLSCRKYKNYFIINIRYFSTRLYHVINKCMVWLNCSFWGRVSELGPCHSVLWRTTLLLPPLLVDTILLLFPHVRFSSLSSSPPWLPVLIGCRVLISSATVRGHDVISFIFFCILLHLKRSSHTTPRPF